jgi:hypothetical protein
MRALRSCALLCVLIVQAAVCGAAPAVLVDQKSCLRRYYRFGSDQISPSLIASQGRKVLGDAILDRLKKETEKSLPVCGNDNFAVFRASPWVLREARKVGTIEALAKFKPSEAAGADWQSCLFRRMFFDPFTAPPPPADWADANFNDGSWVIDRGPFQAGMLNDLPPEATRGNMAKVHVEALQFLGAGIQSSCYRARFTVADPAKSGDLTFQAVYRGGMRVLVNGQEVARGHLPKGDLPPEAPGEDYTEEAYSAPNLRDRAIGPVTVPTRMLRSGVNVLAIEVRSSLLHPTVLKTPLDRSWNALHDREGLWRHGFLDTFRLVCPAGAGSTCPSCWPRSSAAGTTRP